MTEARRQAPRLSQAIWISVIWVLIVGSRNVSAWFQRGAPVEAMDAYMEGSPLDRSIYLALIMIGVILLWRRRIDWGKVIRSNPWLFLLLLYGGVSIAWSDFPFVSLKRWFKGTGNLVMVLIVLTDPVPVEAFKALIRRAGYVLIPASVILIAFIPELGTSYDYSVGVMANTGVAISKNSLGYICLVFGLFFFWRLLAMWDSSKDSKKRKEYLVPVLLLAMIAWLFIKANSATAVLCFTIGVFILLGTRAPTGKGNRGMFNGLALIGVLAGVVLQFAVNLMQVLMSTMGRGMTLTGRTDLWKSLLGMGTNPLVGTGYDSFWLGKKAAFIWEIFLWQPNQAHNGYIEIYLNLGIIGLVLLIAALAFSFWSIRRTFYSDYEFGRFHMAILVVVLFYNVTEAAFLKMHLVWIMFLLISFGPNPFPLLRPVSGKSRSGRLPSR